MARHIAVIGEQWGDEGKGKLVDLLIHNAVNHIYDNTDQRMNKGEFARFMATSRKKPILGLRYQGGSNAGHSLVIDGERISLHQIPSSSLTPGAFSLMDKGVFLNPRKAKKEIEGLASRINLHPGMFGISSKAHVTLDYHVADDKAAFDRPDWTSTGSGIKQTAVDKANRVGIRFAEFLDEDVFAQALQRRFNGNEIPGFGTVKEFVASYEEERESLERYIVQSHEIRKIHGSRFIISEGAQGVMLDMDQGDYPGVTSSNPSHVPGRPDIMLGVFKLYTSSVGTGDRPFISRMPKDLESQLHQPWREFGTTTGKLREIGWFDLVAAKYAAQVTQIDYAAFTCGDRMELLAQMGIQPRMVVGYKVDGKVYDNWDPNFDKRGFRDRAEPVFDTDNFQAWDTFVGPDGRTLTGQAYKFVDKIQKTLDVEIAMIGNGPGRKEVIEYVDLLAA